MKNDESLLIPVDTDGMPKILATNLADHRQLVRDSLLDALDALLDESDYDRITMSDIARRAGVARNTIYNYATDKATLLLAAVRRSTSSMEESVRTLVEADDRSAPERLAAIIRYLLSSFAQETHRVFVLQAQVGTLAMEDRAIATASINAVNSSINRVIEDGTRTGEFHPTAGTELDLAFISGILAAAVRRIALEPATSTKIADEATNFILRALRMP